MNKIHEGHNVKRFREMLRMKQDALAATLGDDWNQKKVSLLEQKETIEPEILEQVAMALKIPSEAIKNFTEEAAVNIISNNTFENSQPITGNNNTCNYNPPETMMQMLEKILAIELERTEMLKELIRKVGK